MLFSLQYDPPLRIEKNFLLGLELKFDHVQQKLAKFNKSLEEGPSNQFVFRSMKVFFATDEFETDDF